MLLFYEGHFKSLYIFFRVQYAEKNSAHIPGCVV